VFSVFVIIVVAQNQPDTLPLRPTNSFNLNLLGDASMVSVHFEKLFFVRPTFFIAGKLGFGYNEEFKLCLFGPCSVPGDKYLTIPHAVTANFGKGRHFAEFGLGATAYNGKVHQGYLLYPILGYRIQPLHSNKLNFRLYVQVPFSGQSPFSGSGQGNLFVIPVGLSLGICF